MTSPVKVTDTTNDLTLEELQQLKKIAKYYSAGVIAGTVIISFGATVLLILQVWSAIVGKLGIK